MPQGSQATVNGTMEIARDVVPSVLGFLNVPIQVNAIAGKVVAKLHIEGRRPIAAGSLAISERIPTTSAHQAASLGR
jgi:hypothetical protein